MPTTNSVEDVYKKQYGSYRELLHREEMPPGFVGMDAVERSAEKVANKPEGKTIRVVSK